MSQKARVIKRSRLYDRFYHSLQSNTKMSWYASNAVVIDANSVRDYLWENGNHKRFNMCVLPPFETTFIEFQMPLAKSLINVGLLCVRDLKPTDGIYNVYIHYVDDNGWYAWKSFWKARCDEFGQVVGDMDWVSTVHAHTEQNDGFHTYPSVAWMTFALLHCKNIALETVKPNPKYSDVFKKEYKSPLTEYKTLVIKPINKVASNSYDTPYQGLLPLHLRRGHFVTYTEDAPAFGKPWGVGTFWKEATLVGDTENGKIVKDYKIKI